MKFFTTVLAALAACSASAFAPSQNAARSTTALNAVEDMPGVTKPLGLFDPLGLAEMGSQSTLAWFRAAELKHGRVAMVANVGFLVGALGLHFPGMLSSDISFESVSQMKAFDQWLAVPPLGQAQIFGTIFLAEIITESRNPHYTKGGNVADSLSIVFPPINFAPSDPEKMKTAQNRELNNGRLAMIGIMSYAAEANIHGSVPLLADSPAY